MLQRHRGPAERQAHRGVEPGIHRHKEVSRRLVDFLSGVAYANNGQIKRVATSTFIITPYNVDIMGDLLDELRKQRRVLLIPPPKRGAISRRRTTRNAA